MCKKEIDSTGNNCIRNTQICIEELCLNQILVVFLRSKVMTKNKKTAMREGQDKFARLMRLDQLLRFPEGCTLNEILTDTQIDDISERQLRDNLKELEEKYGAVFETGLHRGRERLWRYKDTTFSIMQQTSQDMEVIRQSLENLNLFKGDPRYDMLRFYLMGLQKGISETGLNFMSFDNNNEVAGLDYVESILEAITHKYPLKMWYKPFNKDEFAGNIHPYHLRQYNRRWFVFAYSEDRMEIQNYPLDRIVRLEHLSKPYIETDVDFEEYFDEIVGVSNYKDHLVEKVVLKVSSKSIDYIRTKPIHWSQTELKELGTDSDAFFQLRLKVNTELEMLLFSYSDAIEVIEPLWLRDFFAEKTKRMCDMYKV